ncbi:MAG: hypothetical protein LQ344_007120 [Seirophora lacunosa]|nr:MAG: hypothetical protein LQ344_007120 [Seirophora lacunosa]
MPHSIDGFETTRATECAWVTLLTRASYLPGVITLAYSLSTHNTIYPLIVLVTPSLPSSALRALELESHHNPLLIIHPIECLLPPAQSTSSVASRFEDTWTKLRAFSLTYLSTAVFLDADITVYKNMDEVFDTALPASDWIGANHACVCNLDHDRWAPDNWNRTNCAYTPQSHPSALENGTPVPHDAGPPHTHALLNSGFFLYRPSPALWAAMLTYYHKHADLLSTFQFPDQDFLAYFFARKWLPLSWKFNALKTMESWHRNIWRDGEVKGLHYIVDKPWERRVAGDGVAGHLGRDGKTHAWWWRVYGEWVRERAGVCEEEWAVKAKKGGGEKGDGAAELVGILQGLVAARLTDEADLRQQVENRGKGFPVPVPLPEEKHHHNPTVLVANL